MPRQNPFAAAMAMKDATWERHANPWSVWTRVPLLALFALAVYFRGPLGAWLWPVLGLLALWAIVNPRAFPPPASTDNWASKGVFGERVWLNRAKIGADPAPSPRAGRSACRWRALPASCRWPGACIRSTPGRRHSARSARAR